MSKNTLHCIIAAALLTGVASCVRHNAPASEADNNSTSLPCAATPAALAEAADSLWAEAAAQDILLHSVMVVRGDSIIYSHWDNGAHPDSLHVLHSVSKTFTSFGVGLAIEEGLLGLDERIVDIFPDCLPDSVSPYLSEMTVEHLLTMSCGHSHEYPIDRNAVDSTYNWVRHFMSQPVDYKPGTVFAYNSIGTFVLSAAIQRRSGQKLADYLAPRLFEPLGIDNYRWDENPEGINCGGWGLWLTTGSLAKAGKMMLDGGVYNGRQIVPREWIDAMSKRHIPSAQGVTNSIDEMPTAAALDGSDWVQGYGYQVWRCRHNAYRADGSLGQFIVVMPDENAVVVMTAGVHAYQPQLNLLWKHILPVLETLDRTDRAVAKKH